MGVLGHGKVLDVGGIESSPVDGIALKEEVVVEVLQVPGHGQHALDAAEVRNGFRIHQFSAAAGPAVGRDLIEVSDQVVGPLPESGIIFLCPPVLIISVLIVKGAGGIEGVRDLVSDDGPDPSVELFGRHVAVVEGTAQDGSRDADGVLTGIIGGIDLVRGKAPLVGIHLLVDQLQLRFQIDFADSMHGAHQTASLGRGEDDCIAEIIVFLGIANLYFQGIQLFHGPGFCFF